MSTLREQGPWWPLLAARGTDAAILAVAAALLARVHLIGAVAAAIVLVVGLRLLFRRARTHEPADVRAAPRSARLVALAAASVVAPSVLLVQYTSGKTRDVPLIAVACALQFLLVLARMAVLVAEQHRLAVTDDLTGLATRRAFEERLRAPRRDRPFGIVLLDIDHFKRVNDSLGHPAGDRVLREVADRLRAAAGPGVTLARYGGEEFALLAPGADAGLTAELAGRVRAAVGGEPVELGRGVRRAVTVSAGTAVLPGDTADPGELVVLADRALYAAKRAGRDRVMSAGSPPSEPAAGTAPDADVARVANGSRPAGEADERPAALPRPRRSELEAA